MSRPLALSNNLEPTFTNVYQDSSGMGMMMTVSLGVYGNPPEDHHSNLIGVAGTDIPISTLNEKIPYSKLGEYNKCKF